MNWPGPAGRLGLFFLALVLALTGIAAQGLWSFLDGLGSGAAWIDVNPRAAGALPGAAAIGFWSALLLGRRLTERGKRRLRGLSFACVPLIVLLPLGATVLADNALTDRGDERCRIDPGGRFPSARNQRGAPEACPGSFFTPA